MVESMSCIEQGQPVSLSATSDNGSEAEELIRHAFEELDRERARRQELEAELKALQEKEKKESAAAPPKKSGKSRRRSSKLSSSATPKEEGAAVTTAIPPKHFTALQQELEGYRQIVNAMTQEKPAIAAVLKASSARRSAIQTGRPLPDQAPTPPLHVVRLLEIMPWEPKAQEHAFASEEIFEWQVYNAKQRKWCNALNQFPSFFQALPTIKSNNKVQEYQPLDSLHMPGRDRSMLMFLAGCENMGKNNGGEGSGAVPSTVPTEDSVLTNAGLTHLMNIASGFPLPYDGGTWQWVGGWRIEKRVVVFVGEARPQTLDCDENGWTYAQDASDFLKENPEKHCFESPGMVEDKLTLEKSFLSGNKVVRHVIPSRQVRRRKWTRRRVLVDYPHASEQSRHFLKLLAQNASLTFAANKISDQLVETKMKLTDTELKTHQKEEETKVMVGQLKEEIKIKEDVIAKLKQKKSEKKATQKKGTKAPVTKFSEPSKCKIEVKKLEREDSIEKDIVEPSKEVIKPTVNKESSAQQGNDLRVLVSQWVSNNTNKLKVISNDDAANSSDCENPVSDASATSATLPEDDESLLGHPSIDIVPESEEGRQSCSRRNSTSSTNSQQISFDWKKLGRDTIEKFKQLNAAGKESSQDSQGGESTSRAASPVQEASSAEGNDEDLKTDTAAPPAATPDLTIVV